MGLQFNPFTGKLDFVGTVTGGSIGATGATGPAGVTGNQGSTGATGAVAPGGSVGAVDNAVLRADVGTGIVQNSNIIIDDVATTTQDNVAILNASSATNSALVLTPKGTGAFILGPKPDGTATGGNARGAGAVDLQISRTAATQVASASNSFVAGQNNTASTNVGNVAIGTGNTASGAAGSIAIGNSNTASHVSIPAVAFGWGNVSSGGGSGCLFGQNNTSSANYSQSIGNQSTADRLGMDARANGRFAANGDAQRARFVLRCKTTTNAAEEMALDGGTTYLGIPSGKVIACTINISGVSSTGAAVAHYVRQYAVKNVGGTSSQVYAPVTIGTDNAAGTTIALSANNADDTLRIAVTGIAAETWRWVASVDAVEIGYGT